MRLKGKGTTINQLHPGVGIKMNIKKSVTLRQECEGVPPHLTPGMETGHGQDRMLNFPGSKYILLSIDEHSKLIKNVCTLKTKHQVEELHTLQCLRTV